MLTHHLRTLFSIAVLMLLAVPALYGPATTAAQLLETEEFPLSVAAAFCEPGYMGPFVGCSPWDGVTVSVLYETPGGTISDACVTVAGDRAASCTVNVPFGQTVTALINPAMIPAGYVLEGSTEVQVTIPSGPPEGLFSGPAFVLLPAGGSTEESPAESGFTLPASTAFCEPGYGGPFVGCTPWEGVTVSFVSSDGSFSASCVTSGTERAAGCSVEAPFGSTVTASIDPAIIPDAYVLERGASVEISVPGGPPDGVFIGASFVLLPATPTAEEALPIEPAGMPARISTGSCDAPLSSDPVASLEDATEATGPQVGFAEAIPIATSYTEIDVPFDTLMDGNHMLAIYGADEAETLVACGALGGALDDSGALAIGLEPVGVGDNGTHAVAYITPLDDGSRAAVTVFVMLAAGSAE